MYPSSLHLLHVDPWLRMLLTAQFQSRLNYPASSPSGSYVTGDRSFSEVERCSKNCEFPSEECNQNRLRNLRVTVILWTLNLSCGSGEHSASGGRGREDEYVFVSGAASKWGNFIQFLPELMLNQNIHLTLKLLLNQNIHLTFWLLLNQNMHSFQNHHTFHQWKWIQMRILVSCNISSRHTRGTDADSAQVKARDLKWCGATTCTKLTLIWWSAPFCMLAE